MQLAFPFLTIEPLIRQQAFGADPEPGDRCTPPRPPQWNPSLDDMRIQVNTEWHGFELTASQLSVLKCGDVLLLEPGCFDRVEVRFEQQPRFAGRLGTRGNHLAVELTEPIKA